MTNRYILEEARGAVLDDVTIRNISGEARGAVLEDVTIKYMYS